MTNPHSAGLQAGRYTMTSIVIWKKLLKTQRHAQSKTYLRGLLCHILLNSLPLLTRSKICVWCIFCTRWKQPSRKLWRHKFTENSWSYWTVHCFKMLLIFLRNLVLHHSEGQPPISEKERERKGCKQVEGDKLLNSTMSTISKCKQ